MAARASRIERAWRCGLAVAALAALLGIATANAAAATPPAACEEYVVCGQPAGGPSVESGTPANPASPHRAHPGPRPSVQSPTDLPLTGYPLTPILLIMCAALAVGLVLRLLIGLGRRGAATSARVR